MPSGNQERATHEQRQTAGAARQAEKAPRHDGAPASAPSTPETTADPEAPVQRRTRVFGVAAAATFVLLLVALVVTAALSFPTDFQSAGVQRLSSWRLVSQGGVRDVTVPLNLSGGADGEFQAGQEVALETRVTAGAGDTYIYFYDTFAPVRVYANGRQVGAYGQEGSFPSFMADPASSSLLLKIADGPGPVDLRLVYNVPTAYWGLHLNVPVVGSAEAITDHLFWGMGWQMVVAISLLTAALVAMVASQLVGRSGRVGASYFWLGLFLLSSSAWILGQSNVSTVMMRSPTVLHMLTYLGFYFMLVPYSILMRQLMQDRPSLVTDVLVGVSEAFVVVALALQLSGVCQFQQLLGVYYFLLTVYFAYFTLRMGVRVFGRTGRGVMYDRFYLVATLIVSFSLIAEVLNYYLLRIVFDMGLFTVGLAIFMVAVVLGVSLELRTGLIARGEEERLALRLREVEDRVVEDRRWYNSFTHSRRELRRQRNHLHYQLSTIRAYAEDEDIEGLIAYVDDLDASIPEEEAVRYSDEQAVDSVASYYIRKAREAGIEDVEVQLGVTEDLPENLEDDVCALVGNLLSNAIEDAVAAAAEGRTPYVRMSSALLRGSLLNISMDNSFGAAPRDPETDVSLRTIDACAQGHGGGARFEVMGQEKIMRSSVLVRVGE